MIAEERTLEARTRFVRIGGMGCFEIGLNGASSEEKMSVNSRIFVLNTQKCETMPRRIFLRIKKLFADIAFRNQWYRANFD